MSTASDTFRVPRPQWGPRPAAYMPFRRHPTLQHADVTYVPPVGSVTVGGLLTETGEQMLSESADRLMVEDMV
jgi:hypothetical protein